MERIMVPNFVKCFCENNLETNLSFWEDAVMSPLLKAERQYAHNLLEITKNIGKITMKEAGHGIHTDMDTILEELVAAIEFKAHKIICTCGTVSDAAKVLETYKGFSGKRYHEKLVSEYKRWRREMKSMMKCHTSKQAMVRKRKEKYLYKDSAASSIHHKLQRVKPCLIETGSDSSSSVGSSQTECYNKSASLEKSFNKAQQNAGHAQMMFDWSLERERLMREEFDKLVGSKTEEYINRHGAGLSSMLDCLRALVTELNVTGDSDRQASLLAMINTMGPHDAVSSTLDLHSQSYIFPDPKDYLRQTGIDSTLPEPRVAPSIMAVMAKKKNFQSYTTGPDLPCDNRTRVSTPKDDHSQRCVVQAGNDTTPTDARYVTLTNTGHQTDISQCNITKTSNEDIKKSNSDWSFGTMKSVHVDSDVNASRADISAGDIDTVGNCIESSSIDGAAVESPLSKNSNTSNNSIHIDSNEGAWFDHDTDIKELLPHDGDRVIHNCTDNDLSLFNNLINKQI